jgi:hypothetical protein
MIDSSDGFIFDRGGWIEGEIVEGVKLVEVRGNKKRSIISRKSDCFNDCIVIRNSFKPKLEIFRLG